MRVKICLCVCVCVCVCTLTNNSDGSHQLPRDPRPLKITPIHTRVLSLFKLIFPFINRH